MRSETIQPLRELLLAFRGRGATDPRDNIFTLLSIDFYVVLCVESIPACERSLCEVFFYVWYNPWLEGSELRKEQDPSPLLESINNRRSQGNELRRKMRHPDPIDSIRLPGNGTRLAPHESPSEGQRLLADHNIDIARVYIMTMQRLLYHASDLDLLIDSLANTHGLPSWAIDWTVYDRKIRPR
ncbi:hypothetical protein EAF00_007429 [Botryotinia globosa]|nr:hypothetical protein EAF00_007429 [Botryotinia globosa]